MKILLGFAACVTAGIVFSLAQLVFFSRLTPEQKRKAALRRANR